MKQSLSQDHLYSDILFLQVTQEELQTWSKSDRIGVDINQSGKAFAERLIHVAHKPLYNHGWVGEWIC